MSLCKKKNVKSEWYSLQQDIVHIQCEEFLPALCVKQTGRLCHGTSIKQDISNISC